MAKSVISGLTVTIGADTKGFTSALKEIDTQARNIAKDLKLVNQSLKLDPGDAASYADKLKLLQTAASNASSKVDIIKQAIDKLNKEFETSEANALEYAKAVAEVNEAFADGKMSKDDYKRALEDIDKTYSKGTITQAQYEKALKELTQKLESATREQNLAVNSLDEYQRETSGAAKNVDKLGDEQKETNAEIRDLKPAAEEGATGARNLGQSIKTFLSSDNFKNGLKTSLKIIGDIAKKLVDAGKAVFNYSKDAAGMAGNWMDAVETSKRAFAEFADEAVKFAEDQGKIYGIYSGDMLVAMNNLGLMFSSMDLGREQALDMSERVMKMAGDIRAAFGGDINDILEGLNSSFGSTTRSLRQWGVYTSEAELKAYALEKGIVKVEADQLKLAEATVKVKEATQKQTDALLKYGEDTVEYEKATVNLEKAEAKLDEVLAGKVDKLTSAQRATAILTLAEERLADIEGQAIAESDKYPALVNRTSAAFDELKKKIGLELLPVFEDFLQKFLKFLESDEGQSIIESIVKAFGDLGREITNMLQDGTLTDIVDKIIQETPEIIKDIGDIIGKIIELSPEIFDLTEKLLAFFGIKTEAYEAKEAFVAVQDELVLFANRYNISTEDAEKAIKTFAAQNGIYVSQVYKDWETFEPMIDEWMGTLSSDTATMTEQVTTEYDKLGTELQNEVDDIKNTDLSGWDEFAINYTSKIAEFATTMANAWNKYCQPIVDKIREKIAWVSEKFDNIFGHDWETDTSLIDQSTPDWLYGGAEASGGPVKAGRLYRVNDDAGRRTEWFIPGQNGYILNGNQTDRIVNNNNSRTVGTVNIFVESYGTNVAEVADELGTAFLQKTRMTGARA